MTFAERQMEKESVMREVTDTQKDKAACSFCHFAPSGSVGREGPMGKKKEGFEGGEQRR